MPTMPSAPTRTSDSDFERTYGFPRAWVTALNVFGFVFVLASAWGLALYDTHRIVFRFLTAEHGPVELLSAGSFFAACVIAGRLALRAGRRGESRLVVLTYAAFAAAAFLATGEELSWGQALFNFHTPFGLRNINEQGELNVHNLPGMMDLNSAFLFAFGFAGLVGIRAGRSPRFRKIGAPGSLAPLFGWIAAFGALAMVVDYWLTYYTFDMIVVVLAEAVEMLMGFSALAYAWMNTRMLEREWRAASGPGAEVSGSR